jgi:hypothetical protein
VEAELLIPRVEDRENAELAAQTVARIGPKREERVGDRLEEDLIETRLVREDERVEIVGHGEDGVKVVDGQEFGLSGLEPPGLGEGWARGAVAISTRNGELTITCHNISRTMRSRNTPMGCLRAEGQHDAHHERHTEDSGAEMADGTRRGASRRASISKGHDEVGCREKEPREAVRSMRPIVT